MDHDFIRKFARDLPADQTPTTRVDDRDLGFTIVAQKQAFGVDFILYDITGEDCDGGALSWLEYGATSSHETTYDLSKAQPFLHGGVKWDGCSNWHFDEQDRVMIHGCRREDLTRIGEVMARCWDMAAEMLPNSNCKKEVKA